VRQFATHATDHVDCFFSDHDSGRVGVATDEGRHNRRVDDAQGLQTAYAKLRIHYSVAIHTHTAGPDRVIDGIGPLSKHRTYFFVRSHIRGEHITLDPFSERGGVHQPARQFEGGNHVVEVTSILEECRIDEG
jgi:hypothetical protein